MHDRNETQMRRVANAALAVAFAVGIALPCVGTFLKLDTGGLPGENRAMAARPSLATGKLKEFPKKTDAWFNDHFGLRNSLVRLNSRVLFRCFGVSSSSDVVIGKGGWLFYSADRIIESRRGLIPFTDDELRTWQTALEERRDWLASQNIRYVFMIAPEKSSLYAEYLPDELAPVHDEPDIPYGCLHSGTIGRPWTRRGASRLDQLVAWMRAHSTVEVLDLRESLVKAKAEGRIWNLTDTHWNDLGAYAAYAQIAGWLHGICVEEAPVERDAFDRQTHVGPGGDLAGMLALMTRIPEERIVLVPKSPSPAREIETTDAMKKRTWLPQHGPAAFTYDDAPMLRAVVLHDSFFQQVRPFLSRNFARTTFVWWIFPPDIIADEKPDVVIEEMVERLLSRPGFFPVNEPPVAGFKAAK